MLTTIRIDSWLYDKLCNYDLSIQESCNRICKQIKKGRINFSYYECGNLDKFIKVHIQEGITTKQLRDALYVVFKDMKEIKPKIEPSEMKYIGGICYE